MVVVLFQVKFVGQETGSDGVIILIIQGVHLWRAV